MNKHLIIENTKSDNEEQLPGKLDDYEILQVLGEGSFGFVAKVKSRLNHKIYAMKVMNKNYIIKKTKKDIALVLQFNVSKSLVQIKKVRKNQYNLLKPLEEK